MITKVIVYLFDHIDYPAQIRFAVVGTDEWSHHDFDDAADNMLVSLFNDEADKWEINTDYEDEYQAELYDENGECSL